MDFIHLEDKGISYSCNSRRQANKLPCRLIKTKNFSIVHNLKVRIYRQDKLPTVYDYCSSLFLKCKHDSSAFHVF